MAQQKKATVAIDGTTLTWTWASGDETEIDAMDLPENIREQAMLHGLKQKLSDCYAGESVIMQAIAAQDALMDSLIKGVWNAGRSSSGGLWVEALAKAAGKSVAEALEVWNAKSEDERKEIRKIPAVKAAKAEIELERAKAKAEGTELDLADL